MSTLSMYGDFLILLVFAGVLLYHDNKERLLLYKWLRLCTAPFMILLVLLGVIAIFWTELHLTVIDYIRIGIFYPFTIAFILILNKVMKDMDNSEVKTIHPVNQPYPFSSAIIVKIKVIDLVSAEKSNIDYTCINEHRIISETGEVLSWTLLQTSYSDDNAYYYVTDTFLHK